ncbi:helix-turn-helix domain-containing protein (plasmid) [Citricoccus nitrophenolicus]
MELVGTREAAEILGVTQNEVRRLHTSDALTGQKISGRLLFDTSELQRLHQSARAAGRPWSERTAWAALELLSGLGTTLIDQPRTSRLKSRLKSLGAEQVHWLARGRARTGRFRASPRAVGRVATMAQATGDSALSNEAVAFRFGLTSACSDSRFDGYLTDSLDRVISRARLQQDPTGNVILRQLSDMKLAERALGSDALIALDLMDSDDVRERSAGRHKIQELISGL